jgi:hypothetical protein
MKEIINELSRIQKALIAPKDKLNEFAKFQYRNAEGILKAYKKVAGESALLTTTEMVLVGSRYYVQAKATIYLGDQFISATALAREVEEKKGMDPAQVTGSATSYATKYALCGLLAIDGEDDPDSYNENAAAQTTAKPKANPFPTPARSQAPAQPARPTQAQAQEHGARLAETPVAAAKSEATQNQKPEPSVDDLTMRDWLKDQNFQWSDLGKAIERMYEGKKSSWKDLTPKQKAAFVASEKLEALETIITAAIRPAKTQ